MPDDDLTIRRAEAADRPAIVAVCQAALGWQAGDPNAAFFEWKHDRNGFGPSPMWVAFDGDEMIGVRVFLRWRFREGGRTLSMVRAVDTATLPQAQGRGVFRRLTLGAIPDLRDDGVDAVFNTPNDKSRPGYLKMGWDDVGRVPVAVRVAGPLSLPRLQGARTAARKWSEPTTYGVDAAAALADEDTCRRLLEVTPAPEGIGTDRDVPYLAWRYAFPELHYRLLHLGDRPEDGALVFRVRRRGTATEVTVCDVLAPRSARIGGALRALLRGTEADYLVIARSAQATRAACVPVPPLGPRLTWRPVSRPGTPALSDLALTVSDVELF